MSGRALPPVAERYFREALRRAAGDPERVARLELCREYMAMPSFRDVLEERIWRVGGPVRTARLDAM